MGRFEALVALQVVDLELDARRAELRDVQARLADRTEVEAARSAADAALATDQQARRHVREIDAEAEKVRSNLSRLEKRLYDGSTVNPRELQNLQTDIGHVRRHLAEAEERELEAMATEESAAAAAAAAELAATAAAERQQRTATELQARAVALEQEMAALSERRFQAARQVLPEDLVRYERLRPTKQGQAVARLSGGVCGVCRVAASPAKLSQLREGQDLVLCSNCGRILILSRLPASGGLA